jgi:uncharacterized membrane protein
VLLRRAFLVLAALWIVAIPLAAFAASREAASPSVYGAALAVYSIGRLVCHQLPARSFHLWNTSLPVCARCTGIYLGAAAAAIAIGQRRLAEARIAKADPRLVFLFASIPTAATLIFEWTTGITPANWIRALAGLPLGAAVAWAIGMVN